MRSNWTVMLACCALIGSPAARAGSTADDLAQIEAEYVVAKARLRLVETQAQIAARRADLERQAPFIQAGMPTVASIEGRVGHLGATLQLENGFVVEVKVGDTLPNGMRVVSIEPGGVAVRTSANERLRLMPAGEAPVSASAQMPRGMGPAMPYPAAAPASMSLPPLPPPPMTAPRPPAPRVAPGPAR